MSVFRDDHEAARVRVQILEAELAQQRTQLVESEVERTRLEAELGAQSIDRLAAPRLGRPAGPSRAPLEEPSRPPRNDRPRLMTIREWFLLAGFVILGLVSCAFVLEQG